MNILELEDKKFQKLDELKRFTEKVKLEKRKMNEIEDRDFTSVKVEVENLQKQIDEIKAEDAKSVRGEFNFKKNNEKNMNTNFNLIQSIREIVANKPISDETMNTLIESGKREFTKAGVAVEGQIVLPSEYRANPDILAGTANQGAEIVSTQVLPLLTALRSKTVLGIAGADFKTGLVGNQQVPVYTGSNVSWSCETGSTTSGAGTFSDIILKPHRLTAWIDISEQFLMQDGINANESLMQDLINNILVTVENAAFDAVAASDTRPAGMFNGADLSGSLSGTTTYAKTIGIKAAVDTANALTGNLAYITNPAQVGIFETTSIDPNGGAVMIMNNGKINGYPVLSTSNVGTSASNNLVAFGDWNQFIVAQWGGLSIKVDPYSQAMNGKIRIITNTYWDFKAKRTAAFKLSRLA